MIYDPSSLIRDTRLSALAFTDALSSPPPLSRVKRAIKPGKLRGLDVEKIRRFQRWRDACCDARTSAASKFAPLLSLSLSLGY